MKMPFSRATPPAPAREAETLAGGVTLRSMTLDDYIAEAERQQAALKEHLTTLRAMKAEQEAAARPKPVVHSQPRGFDVRDRAPAAHDLPPMAGMAMDESIYERTEDNSVDPVRRVRRRKR